MGGALTTSTPPRSWLGRASSKEYWQRLALAFQILAGLMYSERGLVREAAPGGGRLHGGEASLEGRGASSPKAEGARHAFGWGRSPRDSPGWRPESRSLAVKRPHLLWVEVPHHVVPRPRAAASSIMWVVTMLASTSPCPCRRRTVRTHRVVVASISEGRGEMTGRA